MMDAKTLTLVALALLVGSCASTPTYPPAWGKPILGPSGGCPDVNGTFQNQGEYQDQSGRIHPLAYELFSRRAPLFQTLIAERVDIRMPDSNTLSIRTSRGQDVLNDFTFVRDQKEFSCEDGFLAIRPNLSALGNGGGGLGPVNDVLFLTLSDDGFLVVRHVA